MNFSRNKVMEITIKDLDIILANRYEDALYEVKDKVYTRDLYSKD